MKIAEIVKVVESEVNYKLKPLPIDVSGASYGEEENVINDEKATVNDEGNERVLCSACYKTFTTKSSLKRHEERNPLCVRWKTVDRSHDKRVLGLCIIDMFQEMRNATMIGTTATMCRHCSKNFSNVGNLHTHFKSSTVCNQFAIDSLYKYITELIEKS